MTRKNVFIIIVSIFLIYSCGTYRINNTSDFKKTTNLDSLNGKYFSRPFLSKRTYNQDFFSLINKNNTKSDFFNLEFIDKNNLKISYDEIVENKFVSNDNTKKLMIIVHHFLIVYLEYYFFSFIITYQGFIFSFILS